MRRQEGERPSAIPRRSIPTPITNYVHEEPITGNPHVIVKTPNPYFTGDRLGVVFTGGIGRTRSVSKAQRFSEEFGYEVTLPPGIKPWVEIKENFKHNRGDELESEDTMPIVMESDD